MMLAGETNGLVFGTRKRKAVDYSDGMTDVQFARAADAGTLPTSGPRPSASPAAPATLAQLDVPRGPAAARQAATNSASTSLESKMKTERELRGLYGIALFIS
jgi:hypothetical protein